MNISRVSMYVKNLPLMRDFYADWFGGRPGDLHEGRPVGVQHCHVHFENTVLDLLFNPDMPGDPDSAFRLGLIQFSFSLGTREAVDAKVEALRQSGFTIYVEPRVTVSGRYAATILDPETNMVELTE